MELGSDSNGAKNDRAVHCSDIAVKCCDIAIKCHEVT